MSATLPLPITKSDERCYKGLVRAHEDFRSRHSIFYEVTKHSLYIFGQVWWQISLVCIRCLSLSKPVLWCELFWMRWSRVGLCLSGLSTPAFLALHLSRQVMDYKWACRVTHQADSQLLLTLKQKFTRCIGSFYENLTWNWCSHKLRNQSDGSSCRYTRDRG